MSRIACSGILLLYEFHRSRSVQALLYLLPFYVLDLWFRALRATGYGDHGVDLWSVFHGELRFGECEESIVLQQVMCTRVTEVFL